MSVVDLKLIRWSPDSLPAKVISFLAFILAWPHMPKLRVLTFNVNSIRACSRKFGGLQSFLTKLHAGMLAPQSCVLLIF